MSEESFEGGDAIDLYEGDDIELDEEAKLAELERLSAGLDLVRTERDDKRLNYRRMLVDQAAARRTRDRGSRSR